MKKFSTLLLISMLLSVSTFAQRVAVVDVDRVLASMTTYQDAQAELDEQAETYRQSVNNELERVREMYNKYQAEQVLLSAKVKKQREEEIVKKEEAIRELQRKYFGPEGDLFKKRGKLVKPIQDRVYNIIEKFASDRGYDLVLDKSSDAGVLYLSPKLDKTEDIIKRLSK